MLDRFQGLQIFAALARLGSFTAAAAETGVSRPMASKHIRELEARLGVRLFNRTTRSTKLTDAGRIYLERVSGLLDGLAETEVRLSDAQDTVRGTLRVAAPPAFGAFYLAPIIARFMAQHPEVRVRLDLSDRRFDLVEEAIDVEITVRELEDSSFVARRLGEVNMRVCAAPSYLESCGKPRRPEELARHDCLIYSNNPATMVADWQFRRRGESFHVTVKGRFASNVGDALCQYAQSGTGLVRLPDYIVREPIGRGRLVSILDNFAPALRPIHAVYAHRQYLPARLRQFLEFAANELGRH